MADQFLDSLSLAQPPREMSKPLQALWWLKKGEFRVGPEWELAHNIVVAGEGGKAFDWVHALMHWIDADMSSADYWYRCAGEKRTKPNVALEWTFLVEELSNGG